MQTTRLFLQKINPKLASRVNEHSPGLVSDLVFNGFSERLVLLLPLATDHGETTWTALASKHNISVPSHCMTRKHSKIVVLKVFTIQKERFLIENMPLS